MNRASKLVFVGVLLAVMMTGGACWAQSWLAVMDGYGCTWARIRIVNLSASDVGWTFNNCRTAIESTADSAVTDALADWDGQVPTGEARYVWVYGLLSGDIEVSTAGGTDAAFLERFAFDYAGDNELVLTVGADGVVTASLEPASYVAPAQSGTMPDLTIEEE